MLYNIKKHFFEPKLRYIQQKTLTLRQKILISVSKNITHEGIVVRVEGEKVTVQFVQNSACSGCHAKALCSGGSSESAERRVVANSYGVAYQVGEQVRVVVSNQLAWSAVVVAFLVPMAVALVILFGVVGAGLGEVTASLVTLAVLAVYYFCVWLMRERLDRKAEFMLERC